MHRGILGGIGLFIGLLLSLRAAKIQLYAVASGSMAPALPVGSLVVVGPASLSSLQEGEVITYHLPGQQTRVTHRVVRVQEGLIYTKGDANEKEDPAPVREGEILGRVLLNAPYLGYLMVFFLSAQGRLVIGALVVLFLILAILEERDRKKAL